MSVLTGSNFNLLKDSFILTTAAASNSLGYGPTSAANNGLTSPTVETIPSAIL
jgi:hypothetical protein